MQLVILANAEMHHEGDYEEAAATWVTDNESVWQEWLPEDFEGSSGDVTLAYVEWDSNIVLTYVLANIITASAGERDVSTDSFEFDEAAMWQAVADGDADADAHVNGWLPFLHGAFESQHEDDISDLGTVAEEAAQGLVVPADAPIDSIEQFAELFD